MNTIVFMILAFLAGFGISNIVWWNIMKSYEEVINIYQDKKYKEEND